MKILEISKIQKYLEKFCQNPRFKVKIIKMMVFSAILTFYWPQAARVRDYLVKISFQEGSQNLKLSIFGPKNVGKIQ